jgi:hypothetical protein
MSRLLQISTLTLVGCYIRPDEATDIEPEAAESVDSAEPIEIDPGERGVLSQGQFTLYWNWYGHEEWPEGTCVEARLKNGGESVATWSMELELSDAVTTWVYSDGQWLFANGDVVIADPDESPDLEAGGSRWMAWCAEPRATIDAFSVFSTEWSDPGGEDEEGPSLLSGELSYEDLTLFYRTDGEVEAGACLELTLRNDSDATVTVSGMDIGFELPVEIADSWELASYVAADSGHLTIIWPAYLEPLAPTEVYSGHLCTDPHLDVVEFSATATVVESEEAAR